MPQTAVVILNYNGRKYLSQFLPILIDQTPEADIIVADNRSTDDSLAYLSNIQGIRVIELPQNYGYAGGYNEALRQVDAAYYVLVNSDIEVTPGWLPPLTNTLDHHPDCVAVQPKIRSYHDRPSFEYAGAAGGYLDQFGYPYCRGRIFNTLETDEGQYDDPVELFWATGACFIIRADSFHQQGGFDPDFFAHMEEIDLCWRIKSAGGEIRYAPDSVVYHVGGGTLSKSNPQKTYLNFRNGITLLIKNMPLSRLLLTLPVRFFLDTLAGFKFWIDNKESAHLLAVLRAHKDSILNFAKNYRKRKATSLPEGIFSVAWNYFIANKKRYRDF